MADLGPWLENRVGSQNAAYRKGIVLGLTMAEVGILIIFMLLLLIGWEELQHRERTESFEDMVPIDAVRKAELEEAETKLQEIALALGTEASRPSETFKKLIAAILPAAKTNEGRSNLAEARAALDEMKDAAKQAREVVNAANGADAGKADAVAKRLEQQSYRIANQRGELTRLEKKLNSAGIGVGERPCWVQPAGKIDYLYDVVLADEGIRMRERRYEHRETERRLLRMPRVDPAEVLSEGEFLRRTESLHQYGQKQDCRFFVVVYDTTGKQEKALYKSQLRTVETPFYKFLSDGAPPF